MTSDNNRLEITITAETSASEIEADLFEDMTGRGLPPEIAATIAQEMARYLMFQRDLFVGFNQVLARERQRTRYWRINAIAAVSCLLGIAVGSTVLMWLWSASG